MGKNTKKFLNYVLIISLLVPLFIMEGENNISAAALSKQQACEEANAHLDTPAPFPKCDSQGFKFNMNLWDKYQIATYGGPESVGAQNTFSTTWQDVNGTKHTSPSGIYPRFTNTNNQKGEYRYYGYDRDHTLYSNPFFPNDNAGKGTDPNTRKYVYRPWSSSLMNGVSNKPGGFSPIFGKFRGGADELEDSLPDRSFVTEKLLKNTPVNVSRSTNTSDHLLYMFNYMYIQQDPTVYASGSGRMWHQLKDKIWYQTFDIPKLTGKILPGSVATIEGKDTISLDKQAQDTFTEKYDFSGKIKDDSYYNDRYDKVKYYTRWDVIKWEMTIKVSHNGGALTTVKTLDSQNGDVRFLNDKQEALKDLDIAIKKSDYPKNGQMKIYLETTTTYYNEAGNAIDSDSVEFSVGIGKNPTPPPIIPEPIIEEPVEGPEPCVCEPNIPNDAFDIVEFPASDNTDMSRIESRTVTVDGVSVDPDLFYSGNYIFGDDKDGLVVIAMTWTPKPGEDVNGANGCDTYRIVKVHDTKPRSQFKMNGGTWKENRKITVDNTSNDPNANDPFVTATYPITSYQWTYSALSDSSDTDRRMKVNTDMHKELLYKKKGTYRMTLTATNTLGRTSDVYVLDFSILEDFAPAVIMHPYSSEIARKESVSLFYDAVSTDEDIITTQEFKVYYDINNDESYSKLVETINTPFSEYKPSVNQLGRYRIIATVDEEYGQDTFPEFLTPADKRSTTVEMDFIVENYLPYSDIYSDIPSLRPEIDLYMMLDKNLKQSKINYVKENKVTINNKLRLEGIDPEVNAWDMHTYTYSQAASKSVFTGSSYPPSTTSHTSNGYSGTLNRTSVSNNGYYYDYGHSETVVDVPGHNISVVDVPGHYEDRTTSYSTCSSPDGKYNHPPPCVDGSNEVVTTTTRQVWVSTTYKTEYVPTTYKTVWVSDVQYVDQYTGYYNGTIYKDIREPYTNPYPRITSDKYIVYYSDNIINELVDFNMANNQSDAKVILVGTSAIKSQTAHDHYINNTGKTAEEVIESVVEYIASDSPTVASFTVLQNETFNLYTIEEDAELDPITKKETMYVHDANYYDNPQGTAGYAISEYNKNAWSNQSLRTSFANTGEYKIYRRVKDNPSNDPKFADYSYYSNEAQTIVRVHRKPIAKATLDWDYDSNRNVYYTTWVDDSYDLDHEFSHPEKGIVDRKVKYKLNSSPSWIYKIPDELDPGSYTLEYVVKDVEGVWSFPFVQSFTLQPAPPVQLNAKARTVDTTYTLNSVPASERLSMYEIWTRYPYSHYLSVRLFQGGTARTSETRVNYHTGTKSGNDINWNNITHTIPSTMQDGNYTYRITAVGQGGNTATINFPLTVNTPINLVPNFPNEVTVGDTYATRAITSKYVNMTRVTFWKGTAYQTTIDLTGTTSGYNKNWTRNYTIPSMPDGNYSVEYISTTPSGKQASVTRVVKVINNRPPVAGFELYANNYNRQVPPRSVFEGDTLLVDSTAFDPDPNDYMTWRYDLTYPDGTTDVFTEEDPSFRVLQIGTHRLVQTVTDSYGKSDSVTQTIVVGLLEITGQVSHTDNWLEIHKTQGNNSNVEFYSGEKFMLEADVTVHDIESVRVYFEGEQVNGGTLNLTTDLSQVGPQSKIWNGSLSDNRMVEVKTKLSDGMVQFTFVVSYTNGIEKSDEIYVEIIGSVYDPLNYHRSN